GQVTWLRRVVNVRGDSVDRLAAALPYRISIILKLFFGQFLRCRSHLWPVLPGFLQCDLLNLPLHSLLFFHLPLFDPLHLFLPLLKSRGHLFASQEECDPVSAGPSSESIQRLPARLARLPHGLAIVLVREPVAPAALTLARTTATAVAPTTKSARAARWSALTAGARF